MMRAISPSPQPTRSGTREMEESGGIMLPTLETP